MPLSASVFGSVQQEARKLGSFERARSKSQSGLTGSSPHEIPIIQLTFKLGVPAWRDSRKVYGYALSPRGERLCETPRGERGLRLRFRATANQCRFSELRDHCTRALRRSADAIQTAVFKIAMAPPVGYFESERESRDGWK